MIASLIGARDVTAIGAFPKKAMACANLWSTSVSEPMTSRRSRRRRCPVSASPWLVQDAINEGRPVRLLAATVERRRSDIHAVWRKAPYLLAHVRVSIDALVAERPGRALA